MVPQPTIASRTDTSCRPGAYRLASRPAAQEGPPALEAPLPRWSPDTTPALRLQVSSVLSVALVAIASSAILVRGMPEVSPTALTTWRTGLAALVLLPGAWRGLLAVGRRDAALLGAAGLWLGAHFALWFASLHETTVLRSTVLVSLGPFWSGALSWRREGVPPAPSFVWGLLLALGGVALLAGPQAQDEGGSWQGDLLAVGASVAWSLYLESARELRQKLSASAVLGAASGLASLLLGAVALATGAPLTGFSPTSWALLALALLGPQLIGHLSFAWAVRWLHPNDLSALTLLEPVGATLLAWWLLQEAPSWTGLIGGAVLLLGVAWAIGLPLAGRRTTG